MKKILFTGPESTGKSLLAEQMATRHGGDWVPEYARHYLENLGRPYRQSDLLRIAQGQLRWEDERAARSPRWLFCDTGLLVIKVWSEYKYGSCDPWIVEQLQQRQYDLWVLCGIDIPWAPDPLREHPEEREALYGIYLRELKQLGVPFIELWGKEEERLGIMGEWIAKSC